MKVGLTNPLRHDIMCVVKTQQKGAIVEVTRLYRVHMRVMVSYLNTIISMFEDASDVSVSMETGRSLSTSSTMVVINNFDGYFPRWIEFVHANTRPKEVARINLGYRNGLGDYVLTESYVGRGQYVC